MTKIAEKWFVQDGQIVQQQTHDYTPVLDRNKALRSAGRVGLGKESYLAANIPMKQWHEWAKKHGVSPSDNHAMREVVIKELNDSNNAHFRVWEGRI